MKQQRKKIESAKLRLSKKISNNLTSYKKAIIKVIATEYHQQQQKNKEINIKNFATKLQKKMLVPVEIRKEIITNLINTEHFITTVWSDYFSEVADKEITLTGNDYLKLKAFRTIKFDDIEKEISNAVITEVKKSIHGKYGFNSIRKKLENSGLGMYTAENLTRTALAQFDNAYHVEIAQQAGAEYFLYDGTLSENSRDFCSEHVGRVYTLTELAEMDNKQGLPVQTSLGGYRCQHYLTALLDYNRKSYGELYKG